MKKASSIRTFSKAQVSAFSGGLVDYAVMIICTELLNIYYPISIIISGLIGAVVNFSINRYWTYRVHHLGVGKQLIKFIVVVLGSILLKSLGTYLVTSWLLIDYKISRVLVDIVVSLGFNYTLQTYWVFRDKKIL
ncbi:GtrA family protein [Albibacterium profundi]|uniref:GtrA family protein n=1 Tax=Albibacterium profundi TaxID=3134906 RepID=A0ABV5CAZ1_9SPHI